MPTKTKPQSVKIRFEWFGEFIEEEWYATEAPCPHCPKAFVWCEDAGEWYHCLNCGSLFKYFFSKRYPTESPRIVGLLGSEMINHMTFDELHRLQALKRAVMNLG